MYEKNELFAPSLGLTGPKLVLDLGQCVHIGFTSDSSRFPYALVVVCQGRTPLLLAADDELSARSWLLALSLITHKGTSANQISKTTFTRIPPILQDDSLRSIAHSRIYDRDSQSAPSSGSTIFREEYIDGNIDISFAREIFLVTVQPTETSERLAICGDLQLVVFSHGVGLAKLNVSDCFVLWPVAYIRQYQHETPLSSGGKAKTTIVTLEVGRRSSTGEGVFQFKTQKGQQIIRELKSVVELWCARKAVLPIQQSSSKNSLADGTFKKNAGTSNNQPQSNQLRCQQWNITGRSAPCTPSLAFPHNLQKRWSNPSQNKQSINETKEQTKAAEGNSLNDVNFETEEKLKSTNIDNDVNYIVPAFEEDSYEEEIDHKDFIRSPPVVNPCVTVKKRSGQRRVVTAAVGKDGCVRTKQTRILGAQSLHAPDAKESHSPSDECSYVDIVQQSIKDYPIIKPTNDLCAYQPEQEKIEKLMPTKDSAGTFRS